MTSPLRDLALDRRLLTREELEALRLSDGPAGDMVLVAHLAKLGRVQPDQIPVLLAEASARDTLPATVEEQIVLPLPGQPARRIGRYELIEELGRGGMGIVFRVRNAEEDGPELALKLLLDGDAGSGTRRQRFEAELRLLLRLEHPNLIKIRDGGIDAGRPFYVMDLAPGRDLRQLLREEGAMAPEVAARLVATIARALQFSHDQGVLHRDVKPENVRVDAQLNPVLLDFGVARDMEASVRLTRTGIAIGTPNYMAPEQITGRVHEVDERADVWGLGVLLYELVTGRVPFSGRNTEELARGIATQAAAPLESPHGDVPARLQEVCVTALAKRREDRFGSAGEMADALEADTERQPWLAGAAPFGALAVVSAGLAFLAFLVGPSSTPAPPPRPPTSSDVAAADSATAPADRAASGETPLEKLETARKRARDGKLAEALALLDGGPADASFIRVERRLLQAGRGEVAEGLRLLAAAERGGDPTGAARARSMLNHPDGDGSPAVQEARVRAALLMHDLAAASSASLALSSSLDPAALRAAARVQAARETELTLRLELEPEDDDADASADAGEDPEPDLARRLSAVAEAHTAARKAERPGTDEESQARLWSAQAWLEAARWRDDAAGREEARSRAKEELAPLLARVQLRSIVEARGATLVATSPGSVDDALRALAASVGPASRDDRIVWDPLESTCRHASLSIL